MHFNNITLTTEKTHLIRLLPVDLNCLMTKKIYQIAKFYMSNTIKIKWYMERGLKY